MAVKLFHKKYLNPDSKKYVIILHGLFGMLDNWHNMARKLSKSINVITVDQRNHGKSPHTNTMSFEEMSEDLSELMESLEISSATIIGHSMGGKTAMKFADLYPSKLEKLIVVDIAPKKYMPGHTKYFEALNSINFSTCESRTDADNALAEIEENKAVRQFLLKNLEKVNDGYSLKINLKTIEEFYPKMIDKLEFNWIISTPSLFLSGEKSSYILNSDHANIEETFTNASFDVIANAGHWVHAEEPGAFFESVTSFLQ